MIADGRVDAARPPDLAFSDNFLVKRLAHAVQALELERGRAAGDVGGGERMRIVSGKLRVEGFGVAQKQAHTGEVGHVRVELAREHGVVGEPALLRPLDLAVPVGALDQADGDALARALRQAPQPAQHRDRALAVSLHGEP